MTLAVVDRFKTKNKVSTCLLPLYCPINSNSHLNVQEKGPKGF